MSAQSGGRGDILLGLGANSPGRFGSPKKTLIRALAELERRRVRVEAVSALYETAAIGQPRQPPYLNAVARVSANLPAPALLRVLKTIERLAGRRGGRRWAARPLDIDILDYKGLGNWPNRRPETFASAARRRLVLPHLLLHERPFVLRPLLDVAPDWRHPMLKESAKALWRKVARRREGRILRPVSTRSWPRASLPEPSEAPK